MTTTINADNGVVSGSAGLKSSADATGVLALQTNGTTAVTVDASQNVGVGVTPSAWKSNYKASQVGNATAVVGRTDSNNNYFSSNWFVNSSNQDIYQNTGFATIYSQGAGTHIWYSAASGTAGNIISFTQAMTLDASGNLGVGNTSPAARIDAFRPTVGTYFLGGGGDNVARQLAIKSSTTTNSGDTHTFDAQSGTGILAFATTSTERARIDSSGNVGIGTTTPDIFSRGYGTTLSVSNTGVSGTSIAINSGTSVYPALELGRGGVRKAIFTAQSTVTEFGNLEAVPLTFITNSTERMRVNAGAPILCLSGGSTTATGTGIAFPATQSASSDANTLDDYEEGVFTPSYTCTSGSVTIGTAYDTLSYTKVGRVVTITGQNVVTSVSSPSGTLTIGNLPFTMASIGDLAGQTRPSIHLFASGSGAPTINQYYSAFIAFNSGSTSGVVIANYNATSDSSIADWMATGSDFFVNFSYITST